MFAINLPHKKSIFSNFNNYYMILHGELIITYKGLSFFFFSHSENASKFTKICQVKTYIFNIFISSFN